MAELQATAFRAPLWEPSSGSKLNVDAFKHKQQAQLARWRVYAAKGQWRKLHAGHFDWWMFPIDDGSYAHFNVRCEADVAALLADEEWRAGYAEGVETCVRAWGWDARRAERIARGSAAWQDEMGWTGWDVRLAKVVRSLWLFEHPLFDSVQALARALHAEEKEGRPFTYGHINLNEILHFSLPRRAAAAAGPELAPAGPRHKRRRELQARAEAEAEGEEEAEAPAEVGAEAEAPAEVGAEAEAPAEVGAGAEDGVETTAEAEAEAAAEAADGAAAEAAAEAPEDAAAGAEPRVREGAPRAEQAAAAAGVVHEPSRRRFELRHADGSASCLQYELLRLSCKGEGQAELAPEAAAGAGVEGGAPGAPSGGVQVVMDIWHTETPERHRGKGHAAALASAAFEHARASGWKVRASCSYVCAFAERRSHCAEVLCAVDADTCEAEA